LRSVTCCPESVTRYIHQLIRPPKALQVVTFSAAEACLMVVRASGRYGQRTIAQLRELFPDIEMRIVALYRLPAR
jgi:Trk K+ transport system NAD-binding subunit